jgi:hypothetical protein
MKKNKIYLTLLLSLSSLSGFSQTDFRPGYYISLKNDTVYGLIDYRGEIRDSKVCTFRKDENSEPVKFEPKDIKAYRYTEASFIFPKTSLKDRKRI